MLCGRKAMLDYERKQKTTTAISVLLSAKPDRLTESVEKLKNDSQAKDAADQPVVPDGFSRLWFRQGRTVKNGFL